MVGDANGLGYTQYYAFYKEPPHSSDNLYKMQNVIPKYHVPLTLLVTLCKYYTLSITVLFSEYILQGRISSYMII